MVYTVQELTRDVRVAIDMNARSDALLLEDDVDTLSVDEIIESKLLEATRRVHIEAPTYLLESGHHFGDILQWGELCSGRVILPDDFMRLIVFRMSDWERAVYSAISTDDPEYLLQSSRYKGLRGTAQHPVCAIALQPEGKVLEFYSCKSEDAQITQALYLPYPKIDRYGGIDVCERCKTAIVYMAAGLTATTLGEIEKATNLIELSKTYLQ